MSSMDIAPRDGIASLPRSENPNDWTFLYMAVADTFFDADTPKEKDDLAIGAIERGLVDVHFEECRNTRQMVKKGTRVTLWSEDLAECFHTTV
jgi:hypothetical protein